MGSSTRQCPLFAGLILRPFLKQFGLHLTLPGQAIVGLQEVSFVAQFLHLGLREDVLATLMSIKSFLSIVQLSLHVGLHLSCLRIIHLVFISPALSRAPPHDRLGLIIFDHILFGRHSSTKKLITNTKLINIELDHKQDVGIKECSRTKCFIQTRPFHFGSKGDAITHISYTIEPTTQKRSTVTSAHKGSQEC